MIKIEQMREWMDALEKGMAYGNWLTVSKVHTDMLRLWNASRTRPATREEKIVRPGVYEVPQDGQEFR